MINCCCCCCSGQTGTRSEENFKDKRRQKNQHSFVLLLQVEQRISSSEQLLEWILMRMGQVVMMKTSMVFTGSGAEPFSQIVYAAEALTEPC